MVRHLIAKPIAKVIAGLLSLSLVCAAPTAFAASNKSPDQANSNATKGPRKHLTTIVMAGLAGATLGLSTLSFYGRPQDRLANVPVGFAIGIIIGAGYTLYKAATQPRDFYARDGQPPELWALADANRADRNLNAIPKPSFAFEF